MNSKLDTCVIVEPREHKYLLPVIDNMLNNIPNETIIQVYHGNRNKTTLLNEYKTLINEKIWLFDLELDNLIHTLAKFLPPEFDSSKRDPNLKPKTKTQGNVCSKPWNNNRNSMQLCCFHRALHF